MLQKYSKRYIHFVTVEEAARTLVYAVLMQNDGQKTVALSEPRLVRVIIKEDFSYTFALGAAVQAAISYAQPIVSPFVDFFVQSQAVPSFSYARPPTK
jgi:hypothetical protein